MYSYIYYPCVVVLVLYMICENIGGNQISIKLLIWIEYDGKGVYMGGNENNDGGGVFNFVLITGGGARGEGGPRCA